MKIKLFILSILAATLLASCTPPNPEPEPQPIPSKEELQVYLDSLKAYYPYSADEELVFFNEDLDQSWDIKANSKNGEIPYVNIEYTDTYGVESYGDWYVEIVTPFDNAANRNSCLLQTGFHGQHQRAYLFSYIKIQVNDESILGIYETPHYSKDEILSLLTDTIIVPIQRADGKDGHSDAPAGSYARIVKHQGLTDFSTDGKTVWRRVK